MDIGIYGGTFDPVHKGHVRLAETAAQSCGLDKLIILPDRIPPHKQAEGLAEGRDRAEMCRLAFGRLRDAEISEWELAQQGKSYSVLSLRHFKERYPEDRLWFIMGSDMLTSFHTWYRYKEILTLSGLICMSRYKGDDAELEASADRLRAQGGRIRIVAAEAFEVSSSEIRQRLKNGDDCTGLLDEAVLDYIRAKGLYGTSSDRGSI
ncbi:MAG: nicotinate (nicotinamide) nucleotide adenylyltransferase [Ruminococcus sp.]|nr:nicotinate (nicotinamide) nucleotide adenylyltransferase [Ruminococcus sp.]